MKTIATATTATKTKATATATKPPTTVILQIFELLAELVALGTPQWRKQTKLQLRDVNTGSGYIQDSYSGKYVEFKNYAGGVTVLKKEIQDAKAAAEAAKYATRISSVCGYTAEVSPNGITVGCQKLSWAKFDELVKAVAKAKTYKAPKATATAKK